jgi:hypothetical protein
MKNFQHKARDAKDIFLLLFSSFFFCFLVDGREWFNKTKHENSEKKPPKWTQRDEEQQ